MYDVDKIRQDFPMIVNHPELIYFDNGATTYKPKHVIDAVNSFYTDYTSNVERGDYETAVRADRAYDDTRKIIGRLINCEAKEVAFFANITAALNQVVYGLSKQLKKDDTVLLTQAEHASNLLPWYRLKEEMGINIAYIPVDLQGRIDPDSLEKCLDETVKVVSVAYVTNVLGSVQPLKEVISICHKHNVLTVIDAAQAIGHRKVDVKDLNCDFLCFSSHKMCGPDGAGVMYGKYDLVKDMSPLLLGGGMNARFSNDGTIIYKDAPYRFEAGTPNIEGVIGLGAAAEYLMNIGLENIHQHEVELRAYLMDKMLKLDNINIYNPDDESGPITFNVKDVFAQDAAGYLAAHKVCVRSGNHCAKILHNIIGTDQSIRASLYLYNTKAEADRFVELVSQIDINSAIGIFF
ncbi:MAG: cysteine desulfurase [Erysipelotrichaceae bacterium]|nr:cysteine desulfurase [Erysipelotrichaceae bacterium]